jgi:Dimerisation domain
MMARMSIGNQVHSDTVTGPPPQGRMIELISSLWKTHATAAIARLRVPDHLVHEPRTAAELAGAVSADAGAMARLLRAGTSLGLLENIPPDRYGLTALGECLVTGTGSLRDYAVLMTDPSQVRPLERHQPPRGAEHPARPGVTRDRPPGLPGTAGLASPAAARGAVLTLGSPRPGRPAGCSPTAWPAARTWTRSRRPAGRAQATEPRSSGWSPCRTSRRWRPR